MTSALLEDCERLGKTEARLFTPPMEAHDNPLIEYGIAPEHSWGYQCIDFCEKVLKWELLPWQKWLYVHALEKDSAGFGFRYNTLCILIARQNGKTKWLKGLTLWRLYQHPRGVHIPGRPPPARLALIAMQGLDYAESLLDDVEEDIRTCKALKREFMRHWKVNGKHRLAFKGRRSWRATTANRKGGRSFSVDLADLDELREHSNWKAFDAISPTTIARPNGLVCCTSNAGDATSIVLRSVRDGAVKRIQTGATEHAQVGFFEWSVPMDKDPRDPRWWYLANPAMGHPQTGMTLEKLMGRLEAMEFTNMSGFQTEHLALDVDTPILTTQGWSRMGAITPGDEVYAPDGHPVKVTHATPVYEDRPCYEVTTTDGRTVVCDEDHRWQVQDRRNKRGWETLSTAELLRRGITRNASGGGKFAYRLPSQEAIVSKPVDLPIDPYLLGAWLGDGTAGKNEITCIESEADELAALLPVNICSTYRVGNARRIRFRTTPRKSRDGFAARCRELGVWTDKHIPDLYLTAGTEQRLALLQGLLDTDGSIDESGRVRFASTRDEMARQVLYLARSLGWRATITQGVSEFGGVTHGPSYMVSWTHDASEAAPFRLRRKLARVQTRPSRAGERTTISIRSITPVPSRPVRCITVDGGLFLAGPGLVPTHNCQWVDALDPGIMPADHWFDTMDAASRRAPGADVYACADINFKRNKAYVGIASRRKDGNLHTEVVFATRDLDDLLPWLEERKDKFKAVAMQLRGAPISNYIEKAKALGIPVLEWGGGDLPQGHSTYYDGIVKHRIFHRPAPVLDRAAASTVARNLGEHWVFDRRHSPVDASPLLTMAGATWAEDHGPPELEKTPTIYAWPDEDKIAAWEREAREGKLS